MLEAKVVENIKADVQAVWGQLGDFTSVKPGPGIEAVDYEGEGIGMTRAIHTPNGAVIERLDECDGNAYRFGYAIINEDGPLPFSNYSAGITLADNGDGTTEVTWIGNFDARGIEDEKAIRIASGIYKGAIEGARRTLEG